MSYDEFYDMIEKRWQRGLSFDRPFGTHKMYEHFTYALELHRIICFCPKARPYKVLSVISLKLAGEQRTKERKRADILCYKRLKQIFGDAQWPAPKIKNNDHDCIRMKVVSITSKQL